MNAASGTGRPITTLEILVRQAGGEWESFQQYASRERKLALDQAHRLAGGGEFAAVKLVKETYQPDSNTTSETILFQTEQQPHDGQAPAPLSARRAGNTGGAAAEVGADGAGQGERFHALFDHLAALLSELLSRTALEGRLAGMHWRRKNRHPPAADGAGQEDAAERRRPDETAWEKEKLTISAFMEDSLDRIRTMIGHNDNSNRFGICFFICGACAFLAKQSRLYGEHFLHFVADCLSVVNLPRAPALRFAERFPQYLKEGGRYEQMYQAGSHAIVAFVRDGVSSRDSLAAALKVWNDPVAGRKQGTARPLTLMFTDIVGSSATAERRGDAYALRLLRVHNHIVEAIVGHYRGMLIKHTGDGYLVAFDDATWGVRAAVLILRCAAEHNESFAELPLHLRIGLNAGEAIADRGDLYGSSVNLASRVCVAAAPDQILCTGIVHSRAASGAEEAAIPFLDRGRFRLKGFGDPIPLFEVVWQQDREWRAERAAPALAAAEQRKAAPLPSAAR